jgi:Rrf2 family transcriptional regulator, iron-sulfur cluster assembly transcription factor
MFCSKACEYAIRTMIYLGNQPEGEVISISKLSQELDISFTFLTKVLQQLTDVQLLASFKGAKGGVRLDKSPDVIHIDEIIKAVSGSDMMTLCAIGNPHCDSEHHCPLHSRWSPVKEILADFYKETTLRNYKQPLFEYLLK